MSLEASIYCAIRTQWVKASPEEKVRQQLLFTMINTLGYPASLIVVEKRLKELPHLSKALGSPPNRRIDILCYAKGLHPNFPLYPLLVIECKAVPLNRAVLRQVGGYNYFIGALYYAIANATDIQTIRQGQSLDEPPAWSCLPSYSELLQAIRTQSSG